MTAAWCGVRRETVTESRSWGLYRYLVTKSDDSEELGVGVLSCARHLFKFLTDKKAIDGRQQTDTGRISTTVVVRTK